MQPKEILSLSSGTMSTVMRDSGQWLLYQCRDTWFIDQVQRHFSLYATHAGKPFDTWHDAWRDYERWRSAVQNCFRCSYAGETDYQIDGRGYRVRWSGDPSGPWNDFEGSIRPHIGCIWDESGGVQEGFHQFAPMKVVSAFPGIVPLGATFRWVQDADSKYRDIADWKYIHHPDFGPPETEVRRGGEIVARACMDFDRVNNWEEEPRRRRLLETLRS